MTEDDRELLTPQMRAALTGSLFDLLDHLTTTMFCVKESSGRYVAVNPTFVHRAGKRSRDEVLGRTAGELFLPELAERYETQDALVLRDGRTLRHELELISPPGGRPRWFLTTKVPLRHEGTIIGLVSLSQDVGADDVDDPAMTSLTRVVEYIESHLGEPIRITDLARVAGTSSDTLERRVRQVFHRTPSQLVLTTRMEHATRLLVGTDRSIADIAGACGFYDQAAFSRTFARLTGSTPTQFRRTATRTSGVDPDDPSA